MKNVLECYGDGVCIERRLVCVCVVCDAFVERAFRFSGVCVCVRGCVCGV